MLPDFLLEMPFSTLFIFLLAASISSLTSLANRLLTNPEKSRAWRKEIMEWNAEFRKARREGDKKLLEKVMKKQQYILQLQTKMSWQTMKVWLIFFGPILVIWQVLGVSYVNTDIAYFPGIGPNLPLPLFGSSLLWWYLLCSFLFSTLFSHLFKIVTVE